ncbi:MAG: MATE family efflux transporter [gamma proteobacterium symbiont of Lucinoma myriamae]|nr:MATE family efflux transporter [gamma proteobacterium symbiont of Lucinoma myriamae]MCU7819621.1 MATE family efflux transporter [gamma proteobacterium symbiont of Lucinoma myriamae]MCU7831682.1 MATE family efflux transporter [gamma proteobacterium symbiont of Lucinoma myriamae]
MVGTQFSQLAMGVVDTIMSGQASAVDLAAVAVGSSIWIPLMLFIGGILTAITPTVAHFCGAEHYHKIGHTIRQSLWIGLILSILGFIVLTSIHDLFVFMNVEAPILPIASGYLYAIAWGMPAIAGFYILRYLNEGMANIIPIMLTGILGLMVNILSNYMLIFGHFGAPQLGGIGAGWATTITHWVMLLCLSIYVFKSKQFAAIKLFQDSLMPQFNELTTLLKLGLPIGITFFVEGSIFSIIALFLASLGVVTVAAHQIALSFSSLIFILPLSLSISLTIQVGQQSGAQQWQDVSNTIKAGYLISFSFSAMAALLIVNFSTEIATLYSNDLQVIELAGSLMIFTAFYQFSDGIQLCSAGSLRGLKDTTIPMLLSIIAYWLIGFPLGYALALTDIITDAMGAKGFWIGLLSGLSLSAIFMTIRFYSIICQHYASGHTEHTH